MNIEIETEQQQTQEQLELALEQLEYMGREMSEYFVNLLSEQKEQLKLEADETIHQMRQAEVFADNNDRATQEENFALELKARDRGYKLIKKIEESLQKIKSKDYGYCESCGDEIGFRRLVARPTAALCIDCKVLSETREKRRTD